MNDLEVNDLAAGWLKDGNILGRPVDIIMNYDGSLFVSNDDAGVMFYFDLELDAYGELTFSCSH